ncbi:MAG TPA: hypothetical protein VGF26_24355 [Ramlibacter sp.]
MDTAPLSAPTLHEASRALWLATLSLMAAFMQTQAPAHRYLLARRIARNFETLRTQDCFSPECRRRFDRLGARWQRQADRLRPGEPVPSRWQQVMRRLLRS